MQPSTRAWPPSWSASSSAATPTASSSRQWGWRWRPGGWTSWNALSPPAQVGTGAAAGALRGFTAHLLPAQFYGRADVQIARACVWSDCYDSASNPAALVRQALLAQAAGRLDIRPHRLLLHPLPIHPPLLAEPVKTLKYALDVSQKLVVSRSFRNEVLMLARLPHCMLAGPGCQGSLHSAATFASQHDWCLRFPCSPQVLRLVVRLYEAVPQPDHAAICQCLMFLDDAEEVAAILYRLLRYALLPPSPAVRLKRCLRPQMAADAVVPHAAVLAALASLLWEHRTRTPGLPRDVAARGPYRRATRVADPAALKRRPLPPWLCCAAGPMTKRCLRTRLRLTWSMRSCRRSCSRCGHRFLYESLMVLSAVLGFVLCLDAGLWDEALGSVGSSLG
jgi:hypothetical protein